MILTAHSTRLRIILGGSWVTVLSDSPDNDFLFDLTPPLPAVELEVEYRGVKPRVQFEPFESRL